ncbi:MAG: hypothetical protein RLZZ78_1509 [Armatimonadota bacterium]
MTPRKNEKPIPETPLEVSIRNLSSNGAFVGNVTGPAHSWEMSPAPKALLTSV